MITVTRADISYRDAARELLWRLRLTQPQITQVWADSAYAGQLVNRADDRLWMTLRTISRPRGAKGCVVLPRHWKVERTIGWVMNARRNVHDYERLPHRSEAHMKPGTHCAHDEAAHPERASYQLVENDQANQLRRVPHPSLQPQYAAGRLDVRRTLHAVRDGQWLREVLLPAVQPANEPLGESEILWEQGMTQAPLIRMGADPLEG